MTSKALIRLIAVSLAILFFSVAIGKLDKYSLFCLQLNKFSFAIPLLKQQAWLIPVTELLVAGLLLLPAYRVKALFFSLFIFSIYTIYLTWMLDKGYNRPCRCGEPWQSFSLQSNIIFNFVCVWVSGIGVVLSGRIADAVFRSPKKLAVINENESERSDNKEEACCDSAFRAKARRR